MAFLGFFFWIINARLFSTEQVGIGTALISVMSLISSLSMLGLGNGLIRYLAGYEKKNIMINTSSTIVLITAIIFSVIYLIFIKIFSPKLLFVRENILFAILFILFTVFTSLNVILEDVFIANRSTVVVLIKNTISSIVKLILPVLLVAMGAYGIFMSVGITMAIAFLISLVFLIIRFNYIPKPIININVVKKMTKLSLGSYIGGLIISLPASVLPILIINLIGAKSSAYFYMAMMIAGLLYVVPTATSQSLFAEGSFSETELKIHLKKAIKIISIIIIPAIIIISLFGNYILLAFGKEYSAEGFTLLRFFSISGIFISINSIGATILNIKHKIVIMILVSFINVIVILSMSVILLKYNLFGVTGVVGVGIAWIVGHGITALVYLFLIKKFAH